MFCMSVRIVTHTSPVPTPCEAVSMAMAVTLSEATWLEFSAVQTLVPVRLSPLMVARAIPPPSHLLSAGLQYCCVPTQRVLSPWRARAVIISDAGPLLVFAWLNVFHVALSVARRERPRSVPNHL